MPKLPLSKSLLLRYIALLILLCYPIMGSKVFPFGGGGRYMSVLAGPIALLLIFVSVQRLGENFKAVALSAWAWIVPFIPFVLAWAFVQFWHGLQPADLAPMSRVLWGAVIYIGACRLGVTRRQLACVACIGACAYFSISMVEFFIQGLDRVSGGIYINRFGQFSVWLAGLCFLHFLSEDKTKASPIWTWFLLLSCVLALVPAVLSGSRGALAAIPALFLIMPMMSKKSRTMALWAGLFLLMTIPLVLLFPAAKARTWLAFQEFWQYFTEPVFSETSIGIRLETWKVAFQILAEHPFIGSGFTSFAKLQANQESFAAIPQALLILPDFHSDWGKLIGLGGGVLLGGFCVSSVLLLRRALSDVYRLWGLLAALTFSLAELFFCDKLGFSFFVSTWALYSAAMTNDTLALLKSKAD